MNVYYNPNGIGDVLIFPIKDGDRNNISYQKYGDVVKITDATDRTLLGYNIFRISSYLSFSSNGKTEVTEELLTGLEEIFTKNGLDESLDVDTTPKFVVGFVEAKAPHDNADKLSVCKVDTGDETLQIVCGAPNIDKGQKVVVAKVGARMPSGMEIKPTVLRGTPSNGMICSMKELGLPDAPQKKGIYVLDDGYSIGEPFTF